MPYDSCTCVWKSNYRKHVYFWSFEDMPTWMCLFFFSVQKKKDNWSHWRSALNHVRTHFIEQQFIFFFLHGSVVFPLLFRSFVRSLNLPNYQDKCLRCQLILCNFRFVSMVSMRISIFLSISIVIVFLKKKSANILQNAIIPSEELMSTN